MIRHCDCDLNQILGFVSVNGQMVEKNGVDTHVGKGVVFLFSFGFN